MNRLTPVNHASANDTSSASDFGSGGLSDANNREATMRDGGAMGYRTLAVISLLFLAFGFTQSTLSEILAGFSGIIRSTSILITDYVALGGIGAAFVNAGLLMLLSVALLALLRAPFRGISVAAVFLMGSFGLFGKNIYNVWPIVIGSWLYARLKKEAFTQHVYTALFATCLAPIVTEFAFVLHLPGKTGVPLGILVGVCVGLLAPPLANHLKHVHKGFSLYNIGFTAGIIGTVLVSLLKSYGYQTGFNFYWSSGNDARFGVFLCLLFAFLSFWGFGCVRVHSPRSARFIRNRGSLARISSRSAALAQR